MLLYTFEITHQNCFLKWNFITVDVHINILHDSGSPYYYEAIGTLDRTETRDPFFHVCEEKTIFMIYFNFNFYNNMNTLFFRQIHYTDVYLTPIFFHVCIIKPLPNCPNSRNYGNLIL